jgi:type VI secretion system protein ImpC
MAGDDDKLKGFIGGSTSFQVGGDEKKGASLGGSSGGASAKISTKGPSGDPGEQPLLPAKLLVIAEMIPRGSHNAGGAAPENPVRLDPQDFEEIFSAFRPVLAIEVPSVVHGGQPTRIDLRFDGLRALRPDGLCETVPSLKMLLEARRTLTRMQEGGLDAEQGKALLERAFSGTAFGREVLGVLPGAAATQQRSMPAPQTAPQKGAGDAKVASILDMVDTGDGESSTPDTGGYEATSPAPAETGGKYGNLIGEFIKTARGASGGAVKPHEAIARVDRAMGMQVGAILQHPEVRRLEQLYRGLKLLAERATGVPGLQIEVVSAAPADAPATLKRVARRAEVPVTACLVDDTIDGTAASFTRLEELANVAEAAVVPCIVNGVVSLLGVGALSSVERIDHKGGLFTAPHRAPWRAAAFKPAMRWVTIAMNPLLGRNAYDKQTSRVRELALKEMPDDHEARVWIAPMWTIGALIAKSFKDTQWPCRIAGPRAGIIENLPIHQVDDGGSEVAIPTEAFVSTDSQRELSRIGVLCIASAQNSDAAYVHSAPTAYVRPDKKTYDGASGDLENRPPAVSLVDQLFLARLVQFSRALIGKIGGGASPQEIAPLIEAAVWELFAGAPPSGPEIKVTGGSDAEGPLIEIQIRPRRFLGVELEEIGFSLPIG